MKNKNYILRGGLIGMVLGLIGPYIFLFLGSIPEMIREGNNPLSFFEFETMGWIFAFFVIPTFIILTIVGLIIGWIYGKIKSRNKK